MTDHTALNNAADDWLMRLRVPQENVRKQTCHANLLGLATLARMQIPDVKYIELAPSDLGNWMWTGEWRDGEGNALRLGNEDVGDYVSGLSARERALWLEFCTVEKGGGRFQGKAMLDVQRVIDEIEIPDAIQYAVVLTTSRAVVSVQIAPTHQAAWGLVLATAQARWDENPDRRHGLSRPVTPADAEAWLAEDEPDVLVSVRAVSDTVRTMTESPGDRPA